MKKVKFIIFSLLFLSISVSGQQTKKKKVSNKGKLFLYWGWNWASYTDSDIHFQGDDYNFTLQDVKAEDTPSPFSFSKYFGITNITKPQTNFRIGYFFNENYTISIGVDHMKYVVNNDQEVTINGEINTGNSIYDGVYNNQTIQLTEDFLKLEHTDGLNYINTELYRFDDISHWFGMNSERFQINLTEGLGAGILLPKTDITLLENERYDKFQVAGFGVSVGAGLNITFFKHFFIQTDLKGGYINLNNIKIKENSSDKASQDFLFLQNNILIGGKFRL